MRNVENMDVSDFDIAIVGLECQFPGAENKEQYWENLKNGVESIQPVTEEELRRAGVPEKVFSKPNYVKAASCIDNYDYFAADFFGYSKREAEMMDPQHRLFLEICYHALEDAGYDTQQYDGKVGVFAGGTFNSYLLNNILKGRSMDGSAEKFFMQISNDKDNLATRVSYKLDLTGPSLSLQTACSSSLVALHYACQSLLSQECDMALAGGVTVRCPQKIGYEYEQDMILSKDGHCRPFDADASGTVFGSGVGAVVLKRLSDAIEDGDQIHAVVKATGINNDGAEKVGYTAPGSKGQEEILATVLELSELDKESISAIEAHGTATALGDPIEFESIKKVYGTERTDGQKVAIGSVKGNIGHLECASGMASLIKMVLCLEHETLVPSLHYKKANPHLGIEETGFYVNTETKEWKTDGSPLYCAISSFGIGGTNAHVILGQGAEYAKKENEKDEKELFVFSAKTSEELENVVENMKAFIRKETKEEFSDVAYTLRHGRKPFQYRISMTAGNYQELLDGLNHKTDFSRKVLEHPKTAFVFSGDKNITRQQAESFYKDIPEFKKIMDEILPIVKQAGEVEYDSNPMSFAVKYAVGKMWITLGAVPNAIVTDGENECLAACLSGMMKFEDAWRIVTKQPMEKIELQKTEILCYSNSTGEFMTQDQVSSISYWTQEKENALMQGLEHLKKQDYRIFIEMDAGRLADTLADDQASDILILHIIDNDDDNGIESVYRLSGELWCAGIQIDFTSLEEGKTYRRANLPQYPFHRERYWVEPEMKAAEQETENQEEETVSGEIEESVSAVFAEILGLDSVEPTDDFYEMGGHSLLAIQLVNKLNDIFNLQLKLGDFIADPTVAGITEKINKVLE